MKHITPTILRRPPLWNVISLAVVAVIIALTLLQLFAYEQMPEVMRMLAQGLPEKLQPILLALLVSAGVFGVAYFLPVALSPLARLCSLIAAISMPTIWLWLNLSATVANLDVNAGIFGAKIDISAGALSITLCVLLLLAVLTIAYVDARRSKR